MKPTPTAPTVMPSQGGTYERQADGSLVCIQQTADPIPGGADPDPVTTEPESSDANVPDAQAPAACEV